jgi:hypothetical protein
MRAPRIVEETRYLPITLFDNPEDLEVARMVTLRAITQGRLVGLIDIYMSSLYALMHENYDSAF